MAKYFVQALLSRIDEPGPRGWLFADKDPLSIVRKKNIIIENVQAAMFLWTFFRMATSLSLMIASKEKSFAETIVNSETVAVFKVSFTITLCQDKTEQ